MLLLNKIVGLMLGVVICVSAASAQELRFQDVLNAVFTHHPSLDSARLQLRLRDVDSLQVEAMLDTQLMASAGISDETAPTTSPFAPNGTQMSFLSAQVVKPLADGSSLTAMMNYNRVELAYPNSVPLAFQSSINPTYQHQIDLIYRYPLWRGAGNPSYRYQKEAADFEAKATQVRIEILKEQLTSQAIAMYFQLTFNDLSLKLADDAVVRAKQLLRYQKKREIFGLIERADRLQAAALLATRKLQQVQAVAARDAAQTALNRFMFQQGDAYLQPVLTAIGSEPVLVEDMLVKARGNRPVFAMLTAQYAAAQARLANVADTEQQQLDLVGQIGTRALEGDAGGALGQGFTLNDRFISLRIEFSDTWGHAASRSAVQRGALLLENIRIERRKAGEDLETELATIHALLQSSKVLLKASKVQVRAESKKFKAEMKRYREGRSNTATVTQFEGDLRASELRLVMQEVSLEQAKYQQALALGDLPLAIETAANGVSQ